jgi:phospholipase C
LDGTSPVDPLSRIRHHVIVMMENRSFDHYFGSLSLIEGRADVDGLTASHAVPDADGVLIPPSLLTGDCVADPPHGWSSSHEQFNGGLNDGFVRVHAGGRGETANEAIAYYGRAELPVYYTLADDNALCQRWFASVMGPTWPNRFYALCGTSRGLDNNDFDAVPFPAKSIFRQLNEAGVTWRVYASDISFALLLQDSGAHLNDGHFAFIEDYFTDCANDTLPEVAFVEPSYLMNDDHPPHDRRLGQLFVGTVYQALADSPAWSSALMVVDYDEHGGFYDHVPPPTTADDHAREGFDQLGFRIPALVVGPYVKPGVVSTQFDHTSVLAQIQTRYGLERLTARNEAANDLTDCLDWDRLERGAPRPPTPLPALEIDPEVLGRGCVALTGSGQPELERFYDEGHVPAHLDFRPRRDELIAKLLHRAEKMGLLRVPLPGR